MGSLGRLATWGRPLALALLVGCQNSDRLEIKNRVAFIHSHPIKITGIEELTWDVGDKGNIELTKGIQATIPFPALSEADILTLLSHHKVDSMVLKVERQGSTSSSFLGWYELPLTWLTSYPQGELTVNILYSAAFIRSDGFGNFRCPPLRHRQKLTDFSLKPSVLPGPETIAVDMAPGTKITEDAPKPRQGAVSVNGGHSLLGKYKFSVAMFNSETKYVYSSWKEVAGEIVVGQEVSQALPECEGQKQEGEEQENNKSIFD